MSTTHVDNATLTTPRRFGAAPRVRKPDTLIRAGDALGRSRSTLGSALAEIWDLWPQEARLAAERYRKLDALLPPPDPMDRAREEVCEALHQLWREQHGITRSAEDTTPGPIATLLAAPHRDQDLVDHGVIDSTQSDALDMILGAVAVALRTTAPRARHLILDAHRLLIHYPATFARLEAGTIPAHFVGHLLRVTDDLGAQEATWLDRQVAAFPDGMSENSFRTALRARLGWLASRRAPRPLTEMRHVQLDTRGTDGTACLQVSGPLHEVLPFWHRLDAAARAVQDSQRRILMDRADGAGADGNDADSPAVPFDPDGAVMANGKPLALDELRFLLLVRGMPETGPVEISGSQYRINVTVPAMTLLGTSDAPAMLEGIHPVSADMARRIAADEPFWYRVLTDPASGAFLPLAANRYRPTTAMREHLRLVNPLCNAPGCNRPTSIATEADHIEEFDLSGQGLGGRTEIDNLHHLCRSHHRQKTEGLLDPERPPQADPASRSGPSSTTWTTRTGTTVTTTDAIDPFTPHLARQLSGADPDPGLDPPPPF